MIKQLYKPFQHWSEKGTIWLYSDPHFGDPDLAHLYPTDEYQINMINSKVGRCDTLILLGDIGDIECAKKLRGYKVLICGNHDRGKTIYEDIFDEVYAGPLTISDKIILSHEPAKINTMFNIHGHKHNGDFHLGRLNCCANQIEFTPINFNQFIKSGRLREIETIHRKTIDKATQRKKERENGDIRV